MPEEMSLKDRVMKAADKASLDYDYTQRLRPLIKKLAACAQKLEDIKIYHEKSKGDMHRQNLNWIFADAALAPLKGVLDEQ